MRLREKVFGSQSERELFTSLQTTWSEHFDLWPCLPFLNVFEVDGGEVTQGEWDLLLKTSIDITLCSKLTSRPEVNIEFDGMGHGFSRDGKYVQLHPSQDPNRKLKLDLKLRVADRVGYPLLVLSYDEKSPIGPRLALTIADGIIGQVIAKKRMHESLEEWFRRHPVEELHPSYRDDYIQDQVISAGVAAELEWNPIAKLASQYEYVAEMQLGIPRKRHEVLFDSELPELKGDLFEPGHFESLMARIQAFRNAIRVGCRVVVETRNKALSETVWVRNVSGHGVHPQGVAEDIATVLTLKQAAEAMGLAEQDVLRLCRKPPHAQLG